MRFPSLLEIETGNIVEFQKQIREQFPNESTRMEPEALPMNMPRPPFALSAPYKVYEFYTTNRQMMIHLSKTIEHIYSNFLKMQKKDFILSEI